MRVEYEREAQAIRAKWADAMKEWQANVGFMDMIGGGGAGAAQAGGPDANEQRDAKRDLDTRYYDRIAGALDDDQRTALPDREFEDDWRSGPVFEDG